MQNCRNETRVRMTDRVFRLLEFSQGFISDRWVVASREQYIVARESINRYDACSIETHTSTLSAQNYLQDSIF